MAEAKAILRGIRISPRKARLVVNLIRGKGVEEAFSVLQFLPNHASKIVAKILKSAVSNAEQKEIGDVDDLWISEAFVNQGMTLKRIQPRSMGRANPILKRTSHITLIVTPKTSVKEQAPSVSKA